MLTELNNTQLSNDFYLKLNNFFELPENVPKRIYDSLPQNLQRECQIANYLKRISAATSYH